MNKEQNKDNHSYRKNKKIKNKINQHMQNRI